MIQEITCKLVGNHYYPNIKHNSLDEIVLDSKIERVLDKYKNSEDPKIVFYEQYDIVADFGILQFKEEDIVRYLTTNDEFDIHFYIDNHEFIISSDLYTLLEQQYNFNFHKTLYRVEIW